jgi:DNA-binding transcriptional MerR regulator
LLVEASVEVGPDRDRVDRHHMVHNGVVEAGRRGVTGSKVRTRRPSGGEHAHLHRRVDPGNGLSAREVAAAPATGPQGRRCYDREQLRRPAFLQIGRQLGMSLDELADVLNGPEHRWRTLVENQIAVLTAQIERATRARRVLAHSLECAAPNPLTQCPHFIAELDQLVDTGGTVKY